MFFIFKLHSYEIKSLKTCINFLTREVVGVNIREHFSAAIKIFYMLNFLKRKLLFRMTFKVLQTIWDYSDLMSLKTAAAEQQERLN